MKILHVVTSPRGNDSFSIKLGNAIVDKLIGANPGSSVKVNDVTIEPFPHLEEVHLNSFSTAKEERTVELVEAVKHSDDAISEIFEADTIVIGVPMYNFAIPSTLKTWIDHIVRAGVTFSYAENGPVGFVKGKKIYLAISSGGIYSEGPMLSFDFTEPYLRKILSFLGMVDITAIRVEGVAIPGIKETALEGAIQRIKL